MRFFRLQLFALVLGACFALVWTSDLTQAPLYAQETTGGLQGTVKDPSGALVPRAKVLLSSPAMVGSKEVITDSSGYYRFANLPPGVYMVMVTAQGFQTARLEKVAIAVGRLPTVDIALTVGAEATTVEVSTEAPVIDTTTTQNITNVTSEALQNLPTGITFQSVIQFAPMAREEPLAGMSQNGHGTGGSGGSMPGSSGNGQSFGYSIGGAADSESSYLVEGQDTENISGGYSKANVPMDFIQEVEMKTSGVEAEYGGAIGGVVNVIMKKGSDDFHGSIFSSYESSGLDANPVNAYLRYDPTSSGSGATRTDASTQLYQPKKDHFRTAEPGILVGGPVVKERLWFAAGFEPFVSSRSRYVDFGSNDQNAGLQYFTNDRQQYFGYLRLDAALTKKIRVYGSWLYQYARGAGSQLPTADPIAQESTFLNTSILKPLQLYSHGIGWSAPNATYNVGSDITVTQNLIATTRYGYFFDNYHDIGWPLGVPDIAWVTNGYGQTDNSATPQPLPDGLQNYNGSPANDGTSTTPYNGSYTTLNSDKHYQLNQDFAFFKGGWAGTHNFKFGYQLNHLVNVISQNGNVPYAFMELGTGTGYSPLTETGSANCDALTAEWGTCAGQYGYITVQDFSTILTAPASDWNHAFYAQDAWSVGKGLTLDLGLRIEKESLPAPAGVKVPAINFSWSDKIEPRLGVAWDPTHQGRMKVFGSYGVVNDVMKLLLAQTSWGAQAYEQCTYPLGPDAAKGFSISDLNSLVFKNNRACPNGPANTPASFSTGTPSTLADAGTGVSIIENVNYRPWEPVAPGVKPYRQHEFVAGWDYQIARNYALEVRYDRRRLDHVIEDASLSDVNWGEMFAVINPGEGVNKTVDGYANYLASLGEAFGVPGQSFDATAFGTCASCPAMPKAVRNYDGLEFRMMVSPQHGFSGMFSYTYSSLWGNYTGLTTTDQSDGGTTGRNSPDTTRAFDEPFYYFGANGKSNNGALPTDRPNVVKGYVYYKLPWWKNQVTNVGLFQEFLEGTPLGSYLDVGGATTSQPYDAVYAWGRDKWVDLSKDASGNVTFSAPRTRRTSWYVQSDLNASHEIRIGDRKSISFEATALNAFNQRATAGYLSAINSWQIPGAIRPGGKRISGGAAAYQAYESAYDPQTLFNARKLTSSSQYGQPFLFQNGRTLRLGVHFTF
jgi:outer membrane receptor protein involved in Fe transport